MNDKARYIVWFLSVGLKKYMQDKKISKKTLQIAFIMGLVLLIGITSYYVSKSDNKDIFIVSKNQESTVHKLPIRLKIPSINVDSKVEYVGVTKEGEMDVPKGRFNTAWYKFGPVPGEKGSSVLAGHYGWKNNEPAVFDDLHKVKIGDKIYIENEKSEIIIFVVSKIQVFDKDADASTIFGSNDGVSHLNLITCSGDWDDDKQSRPSRLVVFADKEE